MSLHTQLSQLKWDIFSCMSLPYNLLPIQMKKIVFQNFSGRGYGDNPKYIAEAIIKNHLDYDMVWLCNDMNEDIPHQIRKVKYGSFKAYREMATAGIWVNNVWTGLYSVKRKKQFFLQTWHGSISLKKVEKSVASVLPPEYIRTAKRMSHKCDMMISNSSWLTKQYKRDFWYEGYILEKGLPRLDILYKTPKAIVDKVYNYFGIMREKKILLYAPTFRKKDKIDNYIFDYMKCCQHMKEKFGAEYVLLLRLHPNVAKHHNKLPITKGVYNATDYPDMQELLAVSDTLITDYSSSMFEMGMIEKKVFLLAKDYNTYMSMERNGMMFDLNELPFQMAFNDQELGKNIMAFDQEKYIFNIRSFFAKLGIIENLNSSIDILKEIEKRRIKSVE